MIKGFLSIWLVALALAVSAVVILVILGVQTPSLQTPYRVDKSDFPPLTHADVVFIGSSLTGYALPLDNPDAAPVNGKRSREVLFSPDISERVSTQLVFHAIESGAKTIVLEVNAYAFANTSSREPPFLDSAALQIRRLGESVAAGAKTLLHLQTAAVSNVLVGPRLGVGTFDGRHLRSTDINRLVHSSPSGPKSLRMAVRAAEAAEVELILMLPPRPESVARIMGESAYRAHVQHAVKVAETFRLPLWRVEQPWPDHLFMDALGHANPRGRARFSMEWASWYGSKR